MEPDNALNLQQISESRRKIFQDLKGPAHFPADALLPRLEGAPAAGQQLEGKAVLDQRQRAFFGVQDPLYIPLTGQLRRAKKALMRSTAQLCGLLVYGPEGVGKSSFVRELYKQYDIDPEMMEKFPNGVRIVDCASGQISALWQFAQQSWGAEHCKGTSPQGSASSVLEGQQSLIWLRDVKSPDIVKDFTVPGFKGALIVTSVDDKVWKGLDRHCFVNLGDKLLWAAEVDPEMPACEDKIGCRILASRATGDKSVTRLPPHYEAPAKNIRDLLEGSVQGLACIGNHLRTKSSPQQWEDVATALASALDGVSADQPDNRQKLYAVLHVVSDALSEESKAVLRAMGRFGAGIFTPFHVIMLAFAVDTEQPLPSVDDMQGWLDELKRAALVEEHADPRRREAADNRSGYRLRNHVFKRLRESGNLAGSSKLAVLGSGNAEGLSSGAGAGLTGGKGASAEHLQRCELLNKFLIMLEEDGADKRLGCYDAAYDVDPETLRVRLGVDIGNGLKASDVTKAAYDWHVASEVNREAFAAALGDHVPALEHIPDQIQMLHARAKAYEKRSNSTLAYKDRNQACALEAAGLRESGEKKLLSGVVEEALKDFENAAFKQPQDARGVALRGLAKYHLGRYGDAIGDFNRVEELIGKDKAKKGFDSAQGLSGKDKAMMGWICKWRGIAKVFAEKYSDAVEDLTLAHELMPWDAEVLTFLGTAKGASGELELAIKFLDEALDMDSKCVRAMGVRGEWKRRLGKLEEAMVDLEAARKLDPEYAAVLLHLADVQIDLQRPNDALNTCDQLLAETPDIAARALLKRAHCNTVLGKFEDALNDLERADRLQPGSAKTLRRLGSAKLLLGRKEEALQDFSRSLEIEPHSAYTLERRAAAHAAMKNHAACVVDLDKALNLVPNNVGLLSRRALARTSLGGTDNLELALQDFDRSLLLKPDSVWVLERRAALHADMGNYEKCLIDLEETLKLKPNNVERLRACYLGRMKLGGTANSKLALQHLDRALDILPNDGSVLACRAELKANFGDYAGARADADAALRILPEMDVSSNIKAELIAKCNQVKAPVGHVDPALQ